MNQGYYRGLDVIERGGDKTRTKIKTPLNWMTLVEKSTGIAQIPSLMVEVSPEGQVQVIKPLSNNMITTDNLNLGK